MSDGGLVTAQVGSFTVTSNSAKDEATLRASLKPKVEKALSEAGSQLGKKGGEAAAEKRAAKAEEKPEPTEKPKETPVDEQERRAEAKMAKDAGVSEEKPEEKAEAKPEGEEKAEPEKPEDKKLGNPRHDPRARMLEATRKEAEAKRVAAAAEQRARELEARLAALERGEKPKAEAEAAAPKWDKSKKPAPDTFDTYEEYLDARDEFNKSQWEAELRQQSTMAAVNQAIDAQIGKFHKAAAQNLDKYSDDVLSLKTEFQLAEGETPDGSNWVANELVFSPETAPSLMLHFSAHPEDLQRIAALTTARAVSREMAKLEARLETAPTGNGAKQEEDVSRAAPPVKPVTGKPYVTEEGYRPGMTLDEYARLRKRQATK